MNPSIAIDSLWREDERRYQRFVRVVGLLAPDGLAQRAMGYEDVALRTGFATIISVDEAGARVSWARVTYAKLERFGRAGGYRPYPSEETLNVNRRQRDASAQSSLF